jgi:phosphohistidine swiveling domain-containing protein
MDIEWGKDGIDGQIYILQARPETVKAQAAVDSLKRFRLKSRSEVLVTGRAIGQKVGKGQVRLVRDPREMDRVQEGDVLVTDMTDPDWEPVMKRAAAIVTNRGGRTCHAAIIARELGIPAVVFVTIGALLTAIVPVDQLELGMNVVLVFLAIYLIINFNKKLEMNNRNLYIGGVLSGLMAGLVGTGGAIRGLTLAAFNLSKEVFIATSALIDLGVDFSRAVVYVSQGYFLKEFLILIPFLMLIGFFGSYLGKQILKITSELMFRYIVLFVIIGTSAYQLFEYFLSS